MFYNIRNLVVFIMLLSSYACFGQNKTGAASTRRSFQLNRSIDEGWAFKKDSTVQAEQANFDDASWRRVDLPHDWSVEDLSANATYGPFDPASPGANATGFTLGGTAWYRKKFHLKPDETSRKVFLLFDGVYMNADVWLNGHHLGNHPYGYTPFYYELTDWLANDGSANVIAVRVRNEGKNSRWYSGSGIYRHVSLLIKNPVHIAPWGVYITTPAVSGSRAVVELKTSLDNASTKATTGWLETKVYAANGKMAGQGRVAVVIPPSDSTEITQKIEVVRPSLWSADHPSLYKSVTRLIVEGSTVDVDTTSFGIRQIEFSATSGFLLNGKKVLLKGGCIHHDNGPLGSATIDRAEERKIEILKKNGFNAIRTSHNPPSRQLLDACDRLGMLVIDEAFDMWQRPKNENDYHLWFDEWW
ncbi:MAG TPA: glycoside hydrolase family 2 TIM barrel-domain containing protein, partial [Flavisolibacter sp.]|nr:glycoside hydrolase family 2 TIM barrel-domain containing protein [Flavisolibacter sp.]